MKKEIGFTQNLETWLHPFETVAYRFLNPIPEPYVPLVFT